MVLVPKVPNDPGAAPKDEVEKLDVVPPGAAPNPAVGVVDVLPNAPKPPKPAEVVDFVEAAPKPVKPAPGVDAAGGYCHPVYRNHPRSLSMVHGRNARESSDQMSQ